MRLLKNVLGFGVLLFVFQTFVISTPAHAVVGNVQSVTASTTLSSDGSENGVDFTGDFTLTAPSGTTILTVGTGTATTPTVTTKTNNTGSLGFVGGTNTVTGVIGTSGGNALRSVTAGALGSTTTFGGNVFSTSTSVTDTGTLIFSGNLTGTTVSYSGNGYVRLADGKTITAAVTTQTNNTGSLAFLGGATMAGQVGTSTNYLKSVTGGATAGANVVFQNAVFATTTSVTNTGTLSFGGTLTGTTLNFNKDGLVQFADGANLSVTNVTTATNNTGSINFNGASTILSTGTIGAVGASLKSVGINGGIVTLNNPGDSYYVTTTTVNSNGTFKINSNSTITGAVTLAGTGIMDVGSSTATITGVYTQPANTTLKTTITNSTTAGHIVATTVAPSVAAASAVDITVAGYVPNGTAYTIIDAGAVGITAPTTITDNSGPLTFAATVSSNDLILTATRNAAGIATTGNSTAVAQTLDGFTATGDMATVVSAVDVLSASNADAALQQLDPEVNGGINQAALNATGASLGTIETRLGNARNGIASGDGQVGFSTGDALKDAAVWYQGFGAYGDQDNRSGINGYTATTWGAAAGLDWGMDVNYRMGLAFTYANSGIDTRGSSSSTKANSYQGTLYGTYDDPKWYVDGMLAFAWNTYDGNRSIQFPGIDRTADASYDGQQYSGKATYGYKIPNDNFTLIPLASLLYSHLSLDGYTETGASDVNLKVNSQGYDFLQSGLGARIEIPVHQNGKVAWLPELHSMWLYEYIGDKAEATSTFIGGGSSFKTEGFAPEQSSFNLGAGITLYPQEALSIKFQYDADLRSDYTGQSGTATLRWEF